MLRFTNVGTMLTVGVAGAAVSMVTVRLVEAGKTGHLAALRGGEIVGVPLDDAAVATRTADPKGEMVRTARGLGICFGD